MSLRDRLLSGLPDATCLVRVPVDPAEGEDSVWVAVALRRDGLLHVRNLDHRRFPEELIGVPDLGERPMRGFWSDLVTAAVRLVPPEFGVELLVAASPPVEARLGQSPALVAAVLLAMRPDADDLDSILVQVTTAAIGHECDLPLAPTCVHSADREVLTPPTA